MGVTKAEYYIKKRGFIQSFMAGVAQIVVFLVLTLYRVRSFHFNVSERHAASIFRVVEFGTSYC
jgi:hypothetical protein